MQARCDSGKVLQQKTAVSLTNADSSSFYATNKRTPSINFTVFCNNLCYLNRIFANTRTAFYINFAPWFYLTRVLVWNCDANRWFGYLAGLILLSLPLLRCRLFQPLSVAWYILFCFPVNCEPGKVVKVDCNICICASSGHPNAVCANLWCPPKPQRPEDEWETAIWTLLQSDLDWTRSTSMLSKYRSKVYSYKRLFRIFFSFIGNRSFVFKLRF